MNLSRTALVVIALGVSILIPLVSTVLAHYSWPVSDSTTKQQSYSRVHPKKHKAHRSHSKRRKAHHRKAKAPVTANQPGTNKSGYAYSTSFFLWTAPENASKHLPPNMSGIVESKFNCGKAGSYLPSQLVSAGVFTECPLKGGIFVRREPIKYLIIHSTETEKPADAQRVVKSWNRGIRHPGAQFVVDRDGVIYQTVDPSFGTVHVNIFRTKAGVNNDNSIGVELVRAGTQKYTVAQMDSMVKLAAYLQTHYGIADHCVFGHGDIQPSNRFDPVDFNWEAFAKSRSSLRTESIVEQQRSRSSDSPFAAQPGKQR